MIRRTAPWHRLLLALVLAGAVLPGCQERKTPPPIAKAGAEAGDSARLNEEAAAKIAAEAYIFGFPLVLMDVTREVMTAVPNSAGRKAPINQLGHLRQFPDASFTDVVSPNVDTLYSFAWLDLKHEPMVLSVPDADRRYYLMPLLDAWTNVFASPGSRTTGSARHAFAITGPHWRGELPVGVEQIKSPTDLVWLIGRTQTNGKSDYPAVRVFQDKLKLTPLSAWGEKAYQAPANVPVSARVDETTPPPEQVLKMDSTAFFARLNALMKDNPPAAADAPALRRFATIGVAPGQPFNPARLDNAVARGIERGAAAGKQKLLTDAKKPHGRQVNGWDFMPDTGNYGTRYDWRAVVALVGLGANLSEDALYPRAAGDSEGRPLDGAQRYRIRFAKGQLPPANAFWSLTLYNDKQALAANPLNRYAIGDRDRLKFDKDGSLTIYLQHDSPGRNLQANWLPTPDGPFNLVLRVYWPKPEMLDGRWQTPPIERVDADKPEAEQARPRVLTALKKE